MSDPAKTETVTISFLADPGQAGAVRRVRDTRADRPLTLEQLRDLLDGILALRDAADHRLRAVRQTGLTSRVVHLPGCALASVTVAGRLKLQAAWDWPIPAAWADNPAEWTTLLNAWILANGGDKEAMTALHADTAPALITAWAVGVTCDFATLAAETAALLDYGQPPERIKDRDGHEHPDIAGLLVSVIETLGGTPDYWLYQAPETQVAWLCRGIRERNHAQYAETCPDRMDPKHPKVAARENWRVLRQEIAQDEHVCPGSKAQESRSRGGSIAQEPRSRGGSIAQESRSRGGSSSSPAPGSVPGAAPAPGPSRPGSIAQEPRLRGGSKGNS